MVRFYFAYSRVRVMSVSPGWALGGGRDGRVVGAG